MEIEPGCGKWAARINWATRIKWALNFKEIINGFLFSRNFIEAFLKKDSHFCLVIPRARKFSGAHFPHPRCGKWAARIKRDSLPVHRRGQLLSQMVSSNADEADLAFFLLVSHLLVRHNTSKNIKIKQKYKNAIIENISAANRKMEDVEIQTFSRHLRN